MKNKKFIALLAMTVALSGVMTACSFGGGKEDSVVVESTPTPTPAKKATATPTVAADAQNTTYTSKDKSVAIKLPDATWANKSDETDMLSFESPDQGKILILHGSGADLESAVIPNSQDMAVSMTQAENMVNGTDFEIQDYKSDQKDGINIYSYTVKYKDTTKSDGYVYAINKYFVNDSEYYGEYSDYTRKRGVICSDILLPPHALKEYADRQTLWNAVEKAERGKNAQLAYSFEISLQNEFSLEENIALAREFLFREFVSRGMTVDVSFHEKECEDGGTPNPHFHFLCPIRPMEQDGTWGIKQRREYVLDEEGNRIRDANGKYVFNAVPTTDWGSPETLEHWREAWAEMCNAKFAEKGLDVRIDHRSYERQGVDLLPTIHEGATVRAMEKKGIRTEKGEFNRWIKATNAVIKDIRKKISLLFDWITEIKAELAKPQTPDLVSLLNDYYTQRKAGAYSQKGKISNLKEMNETYNYLRANGIYTLEDLESRLQSHRTTVDGLKTTMDSQNARMKAIRSLNDYSATYKSLKPVYDGLQKIKFEKSRAKYKTEHADKLKMFYTARRKLTEEFPDGKVDMGKLSKEYDTLEQEHETTYAEFKTVREDLQRLWKVKSNIDTAVRFNQRTAEQKLQNQPQIRHKREDMTR